MIELQLAINQENLKHILVKLLPSFHRCDDPHEELLTCGVALRSELCSKSHAFLGGLHLRLGEYKNERKSCESINSTRATAIVLGKT